MPNKYQINFTETLDDQTINSVYTMAGADFPDVFNKFQEWIVEKHKRVVEVWSICLVNDEQD